MKSIEAINLELNETIENLQSVQVKLKQLNQVEHNLSCLSDEKNLMIEQLKKEEKDVENLMKFSFSNLVSTIMNNKEERLPKEEEEAIQAKRKLDEVTYEYDEVKYQLESLLALKDQLPSLEAKYKSLIGEKRSFIEKNYPNTWVKIEENDKGIEKLKFANKEIDEAVWAGDKASSKIFEVLKVLEAAKSWGTYDMLGGGLMSSMIKHQRIDEAKQGIQGLKLDLSRFEDELDDTNISEKFDIRFTAGTEFADIFFDNIFTDMSVQNKIKDSIQDVQNLNHKISSIISQLKANKSSNLIDMEKLEVNNLDLLKSV